jgi:hypothetical protein
MALTIYREECIKFLERSFRVDLGSFANRLLLLLYGRLCLRHYAAAGLRN